MIISLFNIQNCYSSCREIGVECIYEKPLFNNNEGFHCKLKNNFMLGDHLPQECQPKERIYYLRAILEKRSDTSCEILGRKYLDSYGFTHEIASFLTNYGDSSYHAKENEYEQNLCAVEKMKNLNEFILSQSGVLGCCFYDEKNDECVTMPIITSTKPCLCAFFIKTKTNALDFYEKAKVIRSKQCALFPKG